MDANSGEIDGKRDKGDTLIIKADEFKYSRRCRSNAKLTELEADVRSIRRTCIGEIILELKRDKTRSVGTYKYLMEEVLEVVEVRTLAIVAILNVKNLNEITDMKRSARHCDNSARCKSPLRSIGYENTGATQETIINLRKVSQAIVIKPYVE